jgi:magnesium transporter
MRSDPKTRLRARRRRASPAARQADSIGRYATGDVPSGTAEEGAGGLRARLVGQRFAYAELVFVLAPDRRLLGAIRLGDLYAAPEATRLRELMRPDWPAVEAATHREDAASLAIHEAAPGLAVVDHDGRFVGAVSAEALMKILRDEHLEDLHHMVGIMTRSAEAKSALTAPPLRRALFRLPWLLVGMVGSALATTLMASSEEALAQHIRIAFFIPAIVYLADAVGTQAEAVSVRGLSITEGRFRAQLAGELVTGAVIGLVLAAVALPLIWLAFSDARVAAAVSLALFVAASIATGIGALLPWIFGHAGFDPALGSGPIATVIQDVLSLAVYFGIARALVF